MKQGLPIAPNWLCFNEMTANWKKGLIVNDYLELQARWALPFQSGLLHV
jgi:hypothetical protein